MRPWGVVLGCLGVIWGTSLMLWLFSVVHWATCARDYMAEGGTVLDHSVLECDARWQVVWKVRYNSSERAYLAVLSPFQSARVNVSQLLHSYPVGSWQTVYGPAEPLLWDNTTRNCVNTFCGAVYLDGNALIYFRSVLLGVWTVMLASFVSATVLQIVIARYMWLAAKIHHE